AGKVMVGMRLSGEDMTRVADVLAYAANGSATSVEQLGMGFKFAAPFASQLGLSLEETAGLLGFFSNAGYQGAMSGTALRSILTQLSSPTRAGAAQMEALGISIFDSAGKMRNMLDILGDFETAMAGMSQADQAAVVKNI